MSRFSRHTLTSKGYYNVISCWLKRFFFIFQTVIFFISVDRCPPFQLFYPLGAAHHPPIPSYISPHTSCLPPSSYQSNRHVHSTETNEHKKSVPALMSVSLGFSSAQPPRFAVNQWLWNALHLIFHSKWSKTTRSPTHWSLSCVNHYLEQLPTQVRIPTGLF